MILRLLVLWSAVRALWRVLTEPRAPLMRDWIDLDKFGKAPITFRFLNGIDFVPFERYPECWRRGVCRWTFGWRHSRVCPYREFAVGIARNGFLLKTYDGQLFFD